MILTMRITAVRVPLCCGKLDRSKQQRAEPGGRPLSSIGMRYTTLVLTHVRSINGTAISPRFAEKATKLMVSKLIHCQRGESKCFSIKVNVKQLAKRMDNTTATPRNILAGFYHSRARF